MKILSVTQREFAEVTTDEKYSPIYRRIESDIWEHDLGNGKYGGWILYPFPEIIEEAFQEYMRVQNAKAEAVDIGS